jgi:hypothetical protein
MKFYENPVGSSRTVFTVGQKNTHRKSLDTATLLLKKYASNGYLGKFKPNYEISMLKCSVKNNSKFPADAVCLCHKTAVTVALLVPNNMDIRIFSLAKIGLLFVKGTFNHTQHILKH